MNRKPSGLEIKKAVSGFIQSKTAEGLSSTTIVSYSHHLDLWIEFQGETELAKITHQDIKSFLGYMLTEYTPRRVFGNKEERISPKTVRNIWVTLSSFYRWASEEFKIPNVMKNVPAPRFQMAPVEPYTKDEIEALLKAAEYCVEAQTTDRRKFTMKRPTAHRDKAIILTLLDTGIRASEMCALRIGDLDEKTGKITIRHGYSGGAKGKKGRTVYLGKSARKAVWRYLADREDGEDQDAPLFLSRFERPFNKDALRQLIKSLGKKAGVKNAYTHKFRHTFAITYLRSGGDLFTLQSLLGHSSLDVVQIYARVSGMDVENMHRKASPADNWRL